MLGDERGVSDIVGFVLIFGLIMTSVGIIYATGFGNLNDAREFEERQNVERAYEILDDNVREVVRGDAPSRSTQLRLGQNEVTSGNSVNFTVRAYDGNHDEEIIAQNFRITPIEYIVTSSGDSILYMNGAIIRDTVHGSTMVHEPPIRYEEQGTSNERLFIPYIHTRPVHSGVIGVTGGTVNIKTTSTGMDTVSFHDNETYYIEFEISDTPRTEMWKRYCADKGFTVNPNGDPGDETVICATSNDRNTQTVHSAYIQYRSIDVELDT